MHSIVMICLECDHVFNSSEIRTWIEPHGEQRSGCPRCYGAYAEARSCKVCGSTIAEGDLCEDCEEEFYTK